MQSIKRNCMIFLSILFFIALSIGVVLAMPTGQALSQAKAATADFTQLTTAEAAFDVREGNYLGVSSITNGVNIADSSLATVSLEYTAVRYTGASFTPEVFIQLSTGANLIQDIDYTVAYFNNTNVGTASVVVTGIGTCSGSVTLFFDITPLSLENYQCTIAYNIQEFTGAEITPKVAVQNSQSTFLTEGVDYKIVYTNNRNVGKATATVVGINNYEGSTTLNFTITPASIDTVQIDLEFASIGHTGFPIEPRLTVKTSAAIVLQAGVDYKVSYENNTNVGTANVTITGLDNILGTTSKTFEILPAVQAKTNNSNLMWIIIGSSVGGVLLLVLIVLLIAFLSYKRSKKYKYTSKTYSLQGNSIVCKKFNDNKK